jgi:hypothetical protein
MYNLIDQLWSGHRPMHRPKVPQFGKFSEKLRAPRSAKVTVFNINRVATSHLAEDLTGE